MADTSTQPGADSPPSAPTRGGRWIAALMLSAILLGLTGYLAVMALVGDGRPIGCGDGAGCGDVLSSKWAKVFGLPVSGLAVALYLGVLIILVTRKRLGGKLLAAAAGAIIGAAAWFIYVQAVEVEAWCAWCMVDHSLGVVLALILLSATRGKMMGAMGFGLLGVLLLAFVQLQTLPPLYVVEDGGGQRDGQTLTLLDGRLTLDMAEEIVRRERYGAYIETPGGRDRVLVKMYDYNCPHCRHAYRVVAESPELSAVTWVMLPVPMSPACNAYLPALPMAAMTHSCELARLALAIHRIDPGKLEAYDEWAYGESWPHTAAQGRAFAETLVDPTQLQTQLEDPAIDAIIQRNVTAWGTAKEADLVGGLPVHLAPGGGLTYGGIGDGTGLIQLLDGIHHSQSTPPPPPPE